MNRVEVLLVGDIYPSLDKPPDHHQALQNPETKPARRSVTQTIETHFGMRKAPGTSGNTDKPAPSPVQDRNASSSFHQEQNFMVLLEVPTLGRG